MPESKTQICEAVEGGRSPSDGPDGRREKHAPPLKGSARKAVLLLAPPGKSTVL